MEDVIVKVNIKSTDLKAELVKCGYNVDGWDTTRNNFSGPELEINWIGEYKKVNPQTGEVVHSFPLFQFALIRYKGEGEIDLSGSNKISKHVETIPLRVFL